MNRRTEKDSGLRGSTGVDVCFVSIFLVINEQCCFLGLMGGTTTWFWY